MFIGFKPENIPSKEKNNTNEGDTDEELGIKIRCTKIQSVFKGLKKEHLQNEMITNLLVYLYNLWES